MSAQEREAFEAHASQNGRFPAAVERKGDTYYNPITAATWRAWQAARATPAVGAQERESLVAVWRDVLGRCAATTRNGVEWLMVTKADVHKLANAIHDDGAARSAAQGAVQVPAWLPIETAPRDPLRGKIDVWTTTGKRLTVYWDAICGEWRHIDFSGNLFAIKNVTHWMPLPAAPAHAGERSEGGA